MFSKKFHNFRHSLALRLTLWYASIFTISSALAFALAYVLIVSFLQGRIDVDLQKDIEEYAGLLQDGGLDRVKTKIAEDAHGEEARETYFRVWRNDGHIVSASNLTSWRGLRVPHDPLQRLMADPVPILNTLTIDRHAYNIRTIYGIIGPGYVLEIGQSMKEDELFLGALLRGFLITFLAIIVLVSPIGWFMARRALRGVEDITQTASEISLGTLDRRVAVRFHGNELERLAETFNTMLDRIQSLIVGMREMTDSLAHDLRSPLARIRAASEMRLIDGDTKDSQTAQAINTIEECDRLLEIINTTLDIAEAESGASILRVSDVNLVDVVYEACELFHTVAEDRRVALTTSLPEHCHIQGDKQWLQRVISNLLDNALKYTPPSGRVCITLIDNNQTVKLSFEDSGIGISTDDLPRVFQRFYRCDRSRSQPGNGLGLNLARAFVRAHGGDITMSSTLGMGSAFVVILPHTPHSPVFHQLTAESTTA